MLKENTQHTHSNKLYRFIYIIISVSYVKMVLEMRDDQNELILRVCVCLNRKRKANENQTI